MVDPKKSQPQPAPEKEPVPPQQPPNTGKTFGGRGVQKTK